MIARHPSDPDNAAPDWMCITRGRFLPTPSDKTPEPKKIIHVQRGCYVDGIRFGSLKVAAEYIGVTPNQVTARVCKAKGPVLKIKGHVFVCDPTVKVSA